MLVQLLVIHLELLRKNLVNMPHTRIKFRILQDGTVEETVEGISGASCEKLTEELEKKLGNLHHRLHTSDYYKQEVKNVTLQHDQNQI